MADKLVAGSPAYIKRQWVNHHNSLLGACGTIKSHLKRIASCPSASPGARQAAEDIARRVDDMADLLKNIRIEPDGTKTFVEPRAKRKGYRYDRNLQNPRTY